MPRSVRHLLVAMAAVAALAGPAAAQDMTTSDLSRLQQTSDQISTDLQQLRQRDRTAARTLQAELADLDDEIIYLKVKLRKDGNVGRYEFTDLRDRLENLRSRVRGDATGAYSTGAARIPRAVSERSTSQYHRSFHRYGGNPRHAPSRYRTRRAALVTPDIGHGARRGPL